MFNAVLYQQVQISHEGRLYHCRIVSIYMRRYQKPLKQCYCWHRDIRYVRHVQGCGGRLVAIPQALTKIPRLLI